MLKWQEYDLSAHVISWVEARCVFWTLLTDYMNLKSNTLSQN